MEEVEIWKDIIGWEEKYKVSNTARVWNKITDVEVAQVLTGEPLYKYVNLNLNGLYKLRRVHVLVAQAFIVNPDPENKRFVDHGDRDKMNNNLSNLSWVTRSENQRNMNNSVRVGDTLLKDYALRYKNPENAYSYIFRLMNDGADEFEAVEKYEEYLEQGWNRRKVQWEGGDVYLTVLCERYNKAYELVSERLSKGWDIWNAVYDIKPYWPYSFEISDQTGAGHWYRDGEMFETTHPSCLGTWRRLKDEGKTLEEILAYDGKDHLRQTIEGVSGTIEELCRHFNKTMSNVTTRTGKGMSLRDALLSPPERVKKVTIDGVSGSPKYWYEHYGLVYKTVKRKKDTLKCSFEDILKYFGVDLTDKIISYTD